MSFQSGKLPVFDRKGRRLGSIPKWSVEGPRSYRLNDVEDFAFFVPRNDGDTSIITEPTLPTLIGSTAGDVSATSITISRPTGTVKGDKLIALVAYTRASATIGKPTGWALEGSVQGTGCQLRVFSWVVDATNPASYVFTTNGSAQALAAVVVSYRGAFRLRPLESRTTQSDHVRPPMLAATSDQVWCLGVAVGNRDTTIAVPTDWDPLAYRHRSGLSMRVAQIAPAKAGDMDEDRLFQFGSSGNNIGLDLIVQEAPSIKTMLTRDNLIFVDNSIDMPGWGGAIDTVEYDDTGAHVRVLGVLSLLSGVTTEKIEQDAGDAWSVAQRIVGAANAKKAVDGDVQIAFQVMANGDRTTQSPNYGLYTWNGDALDGLKDLAKQTLSEFFVGAVLDSTHGRFVPYLVWAGEIRQDFSDTVIFDGPGGQVTPGTKVTFTGSQQVTYAELHGATTRMSQYVDYPSVGDVIQEITPLATWSSPSDPNAPGPRRRERVDATVNFGIATTVQKDLAKQIQQKYVDLYKTFLYAYHDRWGAPFLPGFEWEGANGDKRLRMKDMRTVNVLGLVGDRTIANHPDDFTDQAHLYDFREKARYDIAGTVGAAVDYRRPRTRWLAMPDGRVAAIRGGELTGEAIQVARVDETLQGVSTDSAEPAHLWALVTTASASTVRRYDIATGTLVTEWTATGKSYSDIAVDLSHGWIYALSTVMAGTIDKLQIDSGLPDLQNPTVPVRGAQNGAHYVGLAQVNGQFLYILGSDGDLLLAYAKDGGYAGHQPTPFGRAAGLLTDPIDRELWLCLPNHVQVMYATLAWAEAGQAGPVNGAPGFDSIVSGRFIHIVQARDRSRVGYHTPPRVDPAPTDGGGGNPGPGDGGGKGSWSPKGINRDATAPALGLSGFTSRSYPFGASVAVKGDLPVIAVLHTTQSSLYAGMTPGIDSGQGTSAEVNAAYSNDDKLFTDYIARNGDYITSLPWYGNIAPRVPGLSHPNRRIGSIKRIMDYVIADRWVHPPGEPPIHIIQRNCTHDPVSGQWTCFYRPDVFVLMSLAATASSGHPVTTAQLKTMAYLIAHRAYAMEVGVAGINASTVVAHGQFDSQANCFPQSQVAFVINHARVFRKGIIA